jgi:hypothetical protein
MAMGDTMPRTSAAHTIARMTIMTGITTRRKSITTETKSIPTRIMTTIRDFSL